MSNSEITPEQVIRVFITYQRRCGCGGINLSLAEQRGWLEWLRIRKCSEKQIEVLASEFCNCEAMQSLQSKLTPVREMKFPSVMV